MTIAAESALNQIRESYPDFGVWGLSAEALRSADQRIVRKPILDDPGHVEVCGHKTKAIKRRWCRLGHWIVMPSANTDSAQQ